MKNFLNHPGKANNQLLFLMVSITMIFLQVACNTKQSTDSLTKTAESISSGIIEEIDPVKISEGDPSSIIIRTTTNTILPAEALTPKPILTQYLTETAVENETLVISIPETSTVTPSNTPIPTSTPRTYWSYMTFTPTPSTSYFRISNLGNFSYVLSPIFPEAIVSAGEDGLVIVELIGEGGRSITKENINYSNYIGQRFGIAPEIEFKLETLSEYGRLIIYTRDRYSRLMDLTSVELVLLELGSNSIVVPKDDTVPIIIRQPDEYEVVKGGVIHITGVARKLSDSPIIIECIDPDGNIVGDALVAVDTPTDIVSHIPFEAFLPYTVSERTNVRFTFRQDSTSRLPGVIYLSSFEITLEP